MDHEECTILVMEDDENDALLLRRALKRLHINCPVHIVSDGEEGIAYLRGTGQYVDRESYPFPGFIITDLKMPGSDGFAVLEFLKSNPEWRVIPTVVLSASSDLDDIKKSYMLGASSYHIKPQDSEALREQLEVINAYWVTCQVPQVDVTGRQTRTNSAGKLGERFPQPGDPNKSD